MGAGVSFLPIAIVVIDLFGITALVVTLINRK